MLRIGMLTVFLMALIVSPARGQVKWLIATNQPCQVYNPRPGEYQKVTWLGDCLGGKASGEGTIRWWDADGNLKRFYDGDVRNGKMHGRGQMVFTDDRRYYKGEWQNGNGHGWGIMTWTNGNRYEGQWQNGYPHGKGTKTYGRNPRHAYYDGGWRNGKMHGRGYYCWDEDHGREYTRCFNGSWRDGKRHGRGISTIGGGFPSREEWKNGRFIGH